MMYMHANHSSEVGSPCTEFAHKRRNVTRIESLNVNIQSSHINNENKQNFMFTESYFIKPIAVTVLEKKSLKLNIWKKYNHKKGAQSMMSLFHTDNR